MQNKNAAEPGPRSRSARAREKKAGSSGLLLTTGAFLIVVCVILYGVYASHKDSGSKQLGAAKPPAADAGNASGNGNGATQGQAGNAGNAAAGNVGSGDKAGDAATGNNAAGDASAVGSADAPDTAASSDGANAAGSGQSDASADASGDEPAADTSGVTDSDTGTWGAADSPAEPGKQQEPAKQPTADTGSKAPTTAGQTAATKLPTTYVVRKGDTLSTISLKFYHSKQYVAFLAQRNGIAFVNDMKVGDTIKIPALTASAGSAKDSPSGADYTKVKLPATYLVRPGDTLYRISVLFYKSGEYASFLAKQNDLDEKDGVKAGTSLRIPVKPASK